MAFVLFVAARTMNKSIEEDYGLIRDMFSDDIDSVVKIHQKAFKGFFLERMGPEFLSVYHHCVFDYAQSVALVHVNEKGVVDGFVAGYENPTQFYAALRSAKRKLVRPVFVALARRPWLILKVLSNFVRVRESSTSLYSQGVIELGTIGVVNSGGGAGGELIRAFIEKSWSLGAHSINLTTDRDDNERAHKFYLKHHFVNSGFEYREGRVLTRYSIENPR
jgi:hypothetical protein